MSAEEPIIDFFLVGEDATTLRMESDLIGISPERYIRLALGSYRVFRSLLSEMTSYFPNSDDTLRFDQLSVVATDGPMSIAFIIGRDPESLSLNARPMPNNEVEW